MSSLDFMEKLLDGVNVEVRQLGEIAEIKRGTSITKKDVTLGEIPVIAGRRTPAYFHNISNRTAQTIVIAGSGAYAGFISWWDQPIFVSDAFTIKTNDGILPKYCFYWLQRMQKQLHDLKSSGGVPHVYPRDVAPIKIPIPCPENPEKSLKIQAELVRILDRFTDLIAELTDELTARKKQFKYYRDHLLTFENGKAEWNQLGCIGVFIRGKRFTKADYVESGIKVIHYGEIYTQYGVSTTHVKSQVRTEMESSLRYAEPGDVILAVVGETVEDVGKAVAWIGDENVAIHDDCYAFRHSMNPKYISYYMQTSTFINQKVKYVSQGKLNRLDMNGFSKIPIPIPSIEEQDRIVSILDMFDTLTSPFTEGLPKEIELRQKQYEYYREMLLSFLKTE